MSILPLVLAATLPLLQSALPSSGGSGGAAGAGGALAPAPAASTAGAAPSAPSGVTEPGASGGAAASGGAVGGALGGTSVGAAAACAGDEGPPPSSSKLARIQGIVSSPEHELHRVSLTLQDRATGNRWVVDHFERCPMGTGDATRFAYAEELLPGTYDLTLTGRFYEAETTSGVTLSAGQVKQIELSLIKEDTAVHPMVRLLPLIFLVSIWLIRWNNIAKPSRLGVIAQLSDLEGQFPPGSRYAEALGAALAQLRQKVAVLDWLFWSRGQEIAGWNLAHKAELALLEDPAHTSLDKINARLATAEQRLSEVDKSAARSLSHRVSVELDCDSAKVSEPARRQLLIEASAYLFDEGDTGFAALTSWQNKSFWLTLVGIALISAICFTEGHASLFLAGAVGGFLSRLTRELKRADVATDYGASWSTLFLSPVAGAISGWFGVALVMLMTDPTVGVLGGPLKVINWDSANVAATLAAAFVLGFSERLFDRIVAQLDSAIDKRKDDTQKTTPKTSPAQRGAAAAAADKPVVAALAPNPVAAGGEVAVLLEGLDPARVTGVVLSAPAGDRPPLDPRLDEGQLKFTVAADTTPGTYRLVLLTPDLDPQRTETDQELTVTAA